MLEFFHIEKSFSGVRVLKDVSFTLSAGRTLGLVGENGAGKSTLMNLVGGNHQPDAGQMSWQGRPYAPRNATDARKAGIAFIHQELNLFPNLSIAENIFLNEFPSRRGLPWIDRRSLHSKTADLLAQVGLSLPPDTLVARLSAGEQQLVEIAKALSFDARLILFDEPTTSLSARETERLFALTRHLHGRGIAMIYISHSLGDVLQLSNEIVVLRDGEVAAAGPKAQFSAERMISLMVGRSLSQLYPTRLGQPAAEPALEVQSLSQPNIVHEISFTLHRGEILGIFGLMGAGRSELARILFGLDPCERGRILLHGQPLGAALVRERIQQGLAFLTEDRRAEGLCMEASIADNIALVSLRQHTRAPLKLIDTARWRKSISMIRQAVRLDPRSRDSQPVKTLSGGNQQKVVLAKWLLAGPRVLILDEPTRGIDVGARFEIYQLIQELADQGAAVLLISSEIEELVGLCDRLLVMSQGQIKTILHRPEFDREQILRSALHEASGRTAAAIPCPAL
jgi:ribose transport system ATP-binding protein